MERLRKQNSAVRICLLAGIVLAAVMVFLMQAMTTLTYDDYYYAVFLREGPIAFFEKNVVHYLVRNGRVLVHMAVEVLLACGMSVYSLANLAILAGVVTLGLAYLRRDGDTPDNHLLCAGATAALVMAADYRIFRSWLLCPADSANYMLPLLAIFGMLLALRREKPAAAMVLSLLCGATTELCAAIGFAIAALEFLDGTLRRSRPDRMRLACLVFILCGMATILLSPATRNRVGGELSLDGFFLSFTRYANSLAAPGHSLLLLTLVTGLLGLGLPGGRAVRWLSIPVVLFLASGWLLPRSLALTNAAFAVFCVYLLLCAGVVIREGTERRCGFVLLGGLASAAVMTLTQSGSNRVTIPFVLMLILCGVHMLASIARRVPGKLPPIRAAVAVLLWAAVLMHIPTLAGIAGNWRIMQQNEASMEPDTIVYQDYDPRYCSQQLFMSADFQRVYLQYLGLEQAHVRCNYAFGPEFDVGGEPRQSILWQDRLYLPLRDCVEAAGGSVELIADFSLEIRVGETWTLFDSPALYTAHGVIDVCTDFISVENQFYISAELLEQEFGIKPVTWEG